MGAALLATVGTAAFGMLLFACSSTTVGTGGNGGGDDDDDDDAAVDSGPVVKQDAGSFDASTDASPTGRTDSGGGGGGSDAAAEAACSPTTVSNSFNFVAPFGPSSACSMDQVNDYVDDCGDNGNADDCNSFRQNNTACIACMETSVNADTWGVVITDPISLEQFANVGGCAVTVDTSANGLACAKSAESTRLCEIQACEVPCSGLPFSDFSSCETAADQVTCAAFLDDYTNCLPDLANDADDLCEAADYDDTVKLVAAQICAVGR